MEHRINQILNLPLPKDLKIQILKRILETNKVDSNKIDKKINTLFIMESEPNLEMPNITNEILEKVISQQNLTEEEANTFVKWLVYLTRWNIVKPEHTMEALKDDYLLGACGLGQGISGIICKNFNVKFTANNVNDVINPEWRHAFLTIELPVNGAPKNYLIDCTFRQFFSVGGYNPESALNCGYYVDKNPQVKETCQKILRDGYIELTLPNWQDYSYGFVVSAQKRHSFTVNTMGDLRNLLENIQEPLDYDEEELEGYGMIVKREELLPEKNSASKAL